MTHTVTHAIEQTERPAAAPAEQTDRSGWRTPGYTVVDTALEVTAYSLSAR
ncbi:pyrroloquinoline quinone precursor peptide PqqA [Streptomyces sp. NPDC002328]|uniref:pyrroloquinoline quinone precursor peptide PqqA n=1 Tax=Streptomyces sp. NPDC002328 TaxID=3364642 RepID=UPI00367ABD2A